MQRKIRVLVGKPGLDGHDRGAKVVAAALRDAGMEVIYTGLHQTAEQVVEAALQEDVDVVALSILSGAHMTLFPEVQRLMRERGIGDKLLTGGGIIPAEDMDTLSKSGVGKLFGPGASTQDIADYLRAWFVEKFGADALPPPPPPPAEPGPPWRSGRNGDLDHAPEAAISPARRKPARRAVETRTTGSTSARSRTASSSRSAVRTRTAVRSKSAAKSRTAARSKSATKSRAPTRSKPVAKSRTAARSKSAAKSRTPARAKSRTAARSKTAAKRARGPKRSVRARARAR